MFLQPSQKRLLSSLNPLVFVGVVFALIVFRTTARPVFPGLVQQWDLLLPFVVYFGQRRTLPEGLILSLFTSHLFSLCSAAPIGVYTTHYLTLFLVARLLSLVIYANTWFSVLLLMFGLSILSRFLLSAVAAGFGHGWPLFASGNFVWWSFFLNALFGYFLYLVLGGLDRLTFKMPRANIELGDTDL